MVLPLKAHPSSFRFLAPCAVLSLVFACTVSANCLLVQAADLLEEGLTLGGLSSHRAEALDAEGLAGLGGGDTPAGNATTTLLGGSRGLAGHNLTALVLHQVGLGQSTDGLLLLAGEDASLGATATSDLGNLRDDFLN